MDKGIRIVKGKYVQARIMAQGRLFTKNFGTDSPLARELAWIWLGERRKEILMGKAGIKAELPRKRFKDVAKIYFELWSIEKNPDGTLKHPNPKATERYITADLNPYFGEMWYDEIRPLDVQNWREKQLQSVIGTSVNREQAVLGSIFGHIQQWIDLGKIEAFKLPTDPKTGQVWNPSTPVEKAELRTHDKILTDYEIQKIRMACLGLNDLGAWEIVKMMLKGALSVADTKRLEAGQQIDLNRSKTGVPIRIPITVLTSLDFTNWRRRWKAVRVKAGLSVNRQSPDFVDSKVLRKTGLNWVISEFGIDKGSSYAAHASRKTTERNYKVMKMEENRPAAQFVESKVDGFDRA